MGGVARSPDATERSGLAQPDAVEFDSGGYGFWGVVRHPVATG